MCLKTNGLLTIQLGMLAKIVGKSCRFEVGIGLASKIPDPPQSERTSSCRGLCTKEGYLTLQKCFAKPWEGSGEVEDFLVWRGVLHGLPESLYSDELKRSWIYRRDCFSMSSLPIGFVLARSHY